VLSDIAQMVAGGIAVLTAVFILLVLMLTFFGGVIKASSYLLGF
jgi:hypothetical protein